MATGIVMLDALREATRDLPLGSRFEIDRYDSDDLMKLTTDELVARGFAVATAEQIRHDFDNRSVAELSKALGIEFVIVPRRRGLIPGENLKRAAEFLKDDTRPLEEVFEEFDRIRHPERYPV